MILQNKHFLSLIFSLVDSNHIFQLYACIYTRLERNVVRTKHFEHSNTAVINYFQ